MFEHLLIKLILPLLTLLLTAIGDAYSGLAGAVSSRMMIRAVKNTEGGRLPFWIRYFNPDAKDDKGRTALFIACEAGNYALAARLLSCGASPNIRNGNSKLQNSGPTPIFEAVDAGNVEIVRLLVNYKALLNMENTDAQERISGPEGSSVIESSLLELAIRKGNPTIVEILLKGGAQPNRLTPMILAISMKRPKLVRLLLAHGMKIDSGWENGVSLLSHAVNTGDRDIVNCLVDSAGASKANAVVCAAALMGNVEKIQEMLQQGFDIKSID